MSEQYYYLLDGQEHGPFSRIAIIKLITSGQIGSSLFRSNLTEPWQTAGEIGLATIPTPPPRLHAKAVGSNPESSHSPLERNAQSSSMPNARQGSKATSSKTGLLLLCCVLVGLGVGAWYLFLRDASTKVDTPSATHPQAQVTPDEASIKAQGNASAGSARGREMTISGEYFIDDASMMFAPDKESLQKYPALLTNDGALTIENAKLAFEQMSIDVSALELNCRYEGQSTIVVKDSREKTPECDDACSEGDCGDSCDPYPVASMVSVKKTTTPKLVPDYSGMCKSGAIPVEDKAALNANPDQNLLRFPSMQEVLDLARRKGTADWKPSSMQECTCTIDGNVIELDASSRLVLYNSETGPSVVAYYWEDNHGNPYTHFYRYDGDWRDAGREVMPGYTGERDDYFEATPDGITKWSKGNPSLKYHYRGGSFQLAR